MTKMYTSNVLKHLYEFPITEYGLNLFPRGKGLIRNPGDMFLVWKTIEYFKPKSLLEIGFYAGQTMGLCLEAATIERILSIDIDYSKIKLFNELFPVNNIEFREQDSRKLEINNEKFDVIIIDGRHEYEYVNSDLLKCLPLLHENSILYMDEYCICPGVEQTISENLLGQHDWVPFLAGVQGMFFHHISHDASTFLDNVLPNKADNFLKFNNNLDWNGFNVLFCEAPLVYTDNIHFMIDVLKFYDL